MKACEGTGGLIGRLHAVALLVVALTAVLVAGVFGAPSAAYAEGVATPIGAVQCDGNNFYPSNFKAINDELAKLKGKAVTIEMYRDWNARDTSGNGVSIPEHLVIPSGTRVTLNMNGYMIDRGLTGEAKDTSVSYGMVILVQGGAVLTVNGGSGNEAKARSHEAYVFTSTEPSGFVAPSKATFSGGLITGGNDQINAGGICMQKGSTVTLNDVTIAGCRDQSSSGTAGTGGGVRMEGGDTTLNMNNSTITGCFADHGGGLYVDNAGKATVNLEDSHVDKNYAKSDGGGIYLHGKNNSITGSGDSSVSNNQCTLNGGGIHAFGAKATVQGVTVQGNGAKDGGGICARNDSIALRVLVIKDNTASAHGGGVCFVSDAATSANYEGDSVLSDCAVQNNTAQTGGGVYFDDYTNQRKDRKRMVLGETTVKDNTSTGGGVRDLLIETDEWGHKRESFGLTDGSEVWAGYQAVTGKTIANDVKNALVTDGKCDTCLHSERSGYVFQFDLEKRFINLIPESEAGAKPTAKQVAASDANNASKDGKTSQAGTAQAGKVGKVGSGGEAGMEYDLIRGFYLHDNETDVAAFYYSDGLFYADPKAYNTHLATLSWAWAYAGGYLNQNKDSFNHQNTNSTDASTYYNKHAAARQFLADIGCADQDIYVNDSMVSKPGTDTIGVAIGSKKLQHYVNGKLEDTGDILIPVAVRGMGYETEWASNVTLDLATEVPGAEARGFSNAASQVVKEIEYYLKKHDLEGKLIDGHVKFWVTGFSRAGATANLTSKRLVDMISEKCKGSQQKSQVFGYPCEAPKGGTDQAQVLPKDSYYCIHNMVNKVDVVPYVAPEQMGFKRYGVDHYIPGTNAGTIKETVKTVGGAGTGGSTTVTTYADNDPTLTKTKEYSAQKTEMIKHLTAVDSNFVFDDHFRPKALDFVSVSQFQTMRIYNEPSNNDNDGYNKAEYFVEDFMRFLQQGPPDKDWGKAVTSRDAYAKNAYTLNGKTYSTIQTALRDLVKMFMGSAGDGMAGFTNKAGNIMNNIPTFDVQMRWAIGGDNNPSFSLTSLYFNVVGNWHKLDDKQKSYWVTSLWNAFKKTGALKELSADDQAKFEASFPTVLNLAFNFVDGDYQYKPKNNGEKGFPAWAVGSSETMMYTPTFTEHASYIISCHMPQVNVAWARSYDSWFNNELNGYALKQPENVDAPKAYGPANGDQANADQANGNQANADTDQTGADGAQASAKQSVEAGVELVEGADKTNRLAGSEQRIILENPNIVGEAIYYDLVDQTNNKTLATNQIYRGGIDLSLDGASSRRFQIKTYDMSYGVASVDATYNVELYTGNHTVIVKDLPKDASAGSLGTQSVEAQSALRVSSDGEHDLVAGSIADLAPLQAQEVDTSAYRTRTFSFAEGEKAVVQADVPNDLFFKQWKVVSKTADGADAYHGIDVAGDVFNPVEDKLDADTSFTMPAPSSDKFPAGYQLQITAQYGTRIKAIGTLVSAPVAGSSLPSTLKATFPDGTQKEYPITWAYKYGDTLVPAHADLDDEQPKAYKNTEYVATIVVPQDTQNDIAFASSVNVSSSVVVQGETKTESKTVQRNDDGNITIRLEFPQTGDGGEASPLTTLAFAVNAIDMNTGQPLATAAEYSVLPNKLITITAPDIEDEQFVGWDLGSTGITTKYTSEENLKEKTVALRMPAQLDDDAAITAQYVPLVKKVEVNLRDAQGNLFEPKSGKSNFANAEAFITITDEYEINPANLQVTWSPALPDDDTYDTMTDYVATVKIVPNGEGKVQAKPKGSDAGWQDVTLTFIPSDDMQATFNGNGQDLHVDEDEVAMSRVFPKTMFTLDAVKQLDNIEGVPYGTGADDIRTQLLPTTTTILATSGFECDAEIDWNSVTEFGDAGDAYDSKVWLASGTVKLPSNFQNPNKVSLDISLYVTVEEADTALAPSATLDSGTYLYDQTTTLFTDEEGGTIYYTLDGSDPADASNDNRILYDEGEEIPISRLDASLEQVPISRIEAESEDADDTYEYADKKALYIRAYTEIGGKRGSTVSMYRYEFDNIPVPEAQNYDYDAEEHIGVEAGPYYRLSVEPGSRARVDEYGNVVATVPGTYKVTASLLLDDDLWALDDKGATSSKDQTIEFTIAGDPLSEEDICDIGVAAVPAEAGTVIGGGSYVKGQTVEVIAWANDGYEFVNWTLDGKEVSSDANYEFTASDDCVLVANFRSVADLYYCAEGSGGTWTKGSNEALAFTFKRSEADETTYGNFTGIEVDGAAVSEKDATGAANYTAASGSVVVSLQPSYLETLSVGDHVVKVLFVDGEAQASFSVVEKSAPAPDSAPTPASATTKPTASANAAPKSGDALANLALLCVTAGCIAAGFVVYSRRRS